MTTAGQPGSSDSAGANGAGDPAAGTGGAGDPAADVARLTAALEAERNAHSATRQQLGALRNTQQEGTPVTTNNSTSNQGQQTAGTPVDLTAALQQIQALTERLNQQELDNSRTKVATKYGLTDEQAARLVGKTSDELEEDAKALTKAFGIKVPGAGDGAEGGEGGAGDGVTGAPAQQGAAGTGAARRTTSTLRTGGANEGDAGRVTSRSEADKIAEEVLSSGF